MITLPQHCEFLSDAWLDEARKFIVSEVARRKDRLGGQPFSGRAALLSPFDRLIHDRRRTVEIFEFDPASASFGRRGSRMGSGNVSPSKLIIAR